MCSRGVALFPPPPRRGMEAAPRDADGNSSADFLSRYENIITFPSDAG